MKKDERIFIVVPKDLKHHVRRIAESKGMSLSTFIRLLLIEETNWEPSPQFPQK